MESEESKVQDWWIVEGNDDAIKQEFGELEQDCYGRRILKKNLTTYEIGQYKDKRIYIREYKAVP